jgi:hypothetical protein
VAQVNLHNLPNSHKVPKQHIIQFTCSGTPVLYGAGYAKSDFTTCLPVPRRCCGQLGRSEQAAFLGPDFGESVLTAVSHRSQHRPGSPIQAQTWPDGSTYFIVQGTPAFAEIGPIYFGLWCAENGVLDQFSHSLLFEIPSSDSLLARTDINTQDRQESAVGVVSAVSAFHRETVLDSTGYCCRPPGPLLPLHATVPGAVAAAAGGGRRRSARQEQSACRSSRENCLHEASGQACCQSARAIRTPDRADNLLAVARGHARRNPHEIRTQTSRRLHSMGHDTAGFTNSIKFRSATARRFCFLLRVENESNTGYFVDLLEKLPSSVHFVPPLVSCA